MSISEEFDQQKVLGKDRSMRRGIEGAAVHMAPALKIEWYRTSLELLGQYMNGRLKSEHIRQAVRKRREGGDLDDDLEAIERHANRKIITELHDDL